MPASDASTTSPSSAPPALGVLEASLEHWQRPLFTFVCGIVNDDELARDLVQDTYVDAWRVARRGAAPFGMPAVEDDIRRWLFHAAYNRAVTAWRRGQLIRWSSLDRIAPSSFSVAATAVPMEDQIVDAHALQEALATLSPNDRACVLLIAVYEFTAAEVGAILGAKAPAITKRYARARRRLRAAYLAQNAPHTSAAERRQP